MTEELRYFLDEEQVCKATEDPDEGIDYIFMLKPEDWKVLSDEWDNHSLDWKCGLTYFAGFCKLNLNEEILYKAINEDKKEIKEQGLLSMHQSLTEEHEETGSITYVFSEHDSTNVLEQLEKTSKEFKNYPEYTELKNMLTN